MATESRRLADLNSDVLATLNAIYNQYQRDPAFEELRRTAYQLVPGTDTPLFRVPKAIFVGEAPGANEDAKGEPFVGRAGKFLDELLGIAGLARGDVFITNVVKYRPVRIPETGGKYNRPPDPDEIDAALPYLRREIKVASRGECKLIVGLGRTAINALTSGAEREVSLTSQHGRTVEIGNMGFSMFVSYHPSWGIRSPRNREVMQKDFTKLKILLESRDGEGT